MTKLGNPIVFRFDLQKAIHASALLASIERDGKSISVRRLHAILYCADRETLKEIGRPITGDRYIVTTLGPVLAEVQDLLASNCDTMHKQFNFCDSRLVLKAPPELGELNRFEIDKLREISVRYSALTDDKLSDLTLNYPEMRKYAASECVSVEDILAALGMSDQIEYVRQNAETKRSAAELWGK